MHHQDWTPVILKKNNPANKPSTTTGYRTQEAADVARLENDEPIKRDLTKTRAFSTNLQNLRLAKRMNQKQFATAMNVKPDIIQGIESGRVIPDATLMQSLKTRMHRLALNS
jgi:ribosome-binding protein aMBF1 (putative translation factor)